MIKRLGQLLLFFSLVSCAGKVFEKPEYIEPPKEFTDLVKVVESEDLNQAQVKAEPKKPTEKREKKSVKSAKSAVPPKVKKGSAAATRQPDIEDAAGFEPGQRRPLRDPFRVGERVRLNVSYFGVHAGVFEIRVLPFVMVNGRKSYRFQMSAKTADVFNYFYKVDDVVTTLVDFETLRPTTFKLEVNESAQTIKSNLYFNWETLRAKQWQSRFTKSKGVEEKVTEWELMPFAQNVFSAPFYMRIFQFEPDKVYSFRVADEGKNIQFKGHLVREELLGTKKGALQTKVIKAEFEIDGLFAQTGDVYFWLTNDDRKMIVKIEAKIKIGKLVLELEDIDRPE